MSRRTRQLPGFTLIELVLSIAIMTILVGGMASAVLIASKSLPNTNDLSERTATAVDAADALAGDLATAIAMIQATPTLIEFTVPDRGHGTAGPETIRYAWSGTPGAPLTRQYNGGTATTIAEPVQAFSLAYTTQAGALKAPPRVLLVSKDPTNPSDNETARRQAMQSGGFAVQSIAETCTPAQFATVLLSADVVYTLPETTWNHFGDKPTDISQGVVIADYELYVRYGVATNLQWTNNTDTIYTTVTPHPVTNGLPSGPIKFCSTPLSFSVGISVAVHAFWA